MDDINLLSNTVFVVMLAVISVIDLLAKGYALWKAAMNNQIVWFIAILFLNTGGILPLVYLGFFQKK